MPLYGKLLSACHLSISRMRLMNPFYPKISKGNKSFTHRHYSELGDQL